MRKTEKTSKTKGAAKKLLRTVLVIVLFAGAAFAFTVFTDNFRFFEGTSFRYAIINDVEAPKVTVGYYDVEYSTWMPEESLQAFTALMNLDRKFEQFNTDASVLNEEFKNIWNDHGSALMNYNMISLTDTHPAGGEYTELHVGGMIRKEYTFTNTSTIPVYIRIQTPILIGNIKASAHFINWRTDQTGHIYDDSNDGYIYMLNPIETNEEVTIEVIAYIPYGGNEGINHSVNAEIIIEYAEIIQSANNAVYFAEGWREVAEEGLFASKIKE